MKKRKFITLLSLSISLLSISACSSTSEKTQSLPSTVAETTKSQNTTESSEKSTAEQQELQDFAETFEKWLNHPSKMGIVRVEGDVIAVVLAIDKSTVTDEKLLELAQNIQEIKKNVIKAHRVTNPDFEEPYMAIADEKIKWFAVETEDDEHTIKLLKK